MPRSQQPGAERAIFRAYISMTSIAGLNVELVNGAASGVTACIRKVRLYSLVANQWKLTRNTAAATGGTPAGGTISRSR